MADKNDPLKGWRTVTLWLQVSQNGTPGKRLEFNIQMPPETTPAQKTQLCANVAPQLAEMLFDRYGREIAIVQGQYKEEVDVAENVGS